MTESENFASVPQAVPTRQKYRDDDRGESSRANIMQDRRVIRGNTYASALQPVDDPMKIQKQRAAQRQRLNRANQRKDAPSTPDAVHGRKHMDIQTDTYLEELTERTVAFEAETMTDFLLDRPPSPLFMPAKVGADMETQIAEGDLFDFDREAEVVLEILVGKTLEISMMEVLEEEEISAMRVHQQEYEHMRAQELLEVNRIEAQEQRRADECERRKTQAKSREELNTQLLNKIASRRVAMDYLSSLKRRAMESLLDSGTIAAQDSAPVDIDAEFMPWLQNQVRSRMDVRKRNRDLFEDLATQAAHDNTKQRRKVLQAGRAALLEVEQAERRIQWENDEKLRLQQMEEERIQKEQAGLLEQENEAYMVEVEVMEFSEEGLKLADESTVELSEELKAELTAKWAEKAEGDRIFLMINKTVDEGTELKIIVAEVPPAEEAEPTEEAPAEA